MIVDTSAVIAVLWGEPDADEFARLLATTSCAMSVATHLECAIVIDARGNPVVSRRFDDLVDATPIRLVPVSTAQGRIARAAYRDFGKGSGHPAGLNFGDCFAYALARDLGEPLLYKGDDFTHTDIIPAFD